MCSFIYLLVSEISGSHGSEYEVETFWDTAPGSLVGSPR
jgi:hypothetical protein